MYGIIYYVFNKKRIYKSLTCTKVTTTNIFHQRLQKFSNYLY